MSTASRVGLLTACVICAGALVLVALGWLDPLWLVAALPGGALVGTLVAAGLTRRAMGLTGAWEPGRAAARLAPSNASVRGVAGSYQHTAPDPHRDADTDRAE